MSSNRRALSLIELLVVIAIIGILIALILVAVQRVRSAAARVDCLNKFKQIGLSLQAYHDQNSEFPTGMSDHEDKRKQVFMTWMTRLLPYLNYEQLWRDSVAAYQHYPNFWEGTHIPIIGTKIKEYICPADLYAQEPDYLKNIPDIKIAFTSYLGVSGTDYNMWDGILHTNSHTTIRSITDGLSNTLIVGERPVIYGSQKFDRRFGWWYAGYGQGTSGSGDSILGVEEKFVSLDLGNCIEQAKFKPGDLKNTCDVLHFWSLHNSGANFLFADGSAKFLTYESEPSMVPMSTRAKGDAIPE